MDRLRGLPAVLDADRLYLQLERALRHIRPAFDRQVTEGLPAPARVRLELWVTDTVHAASYALDETHASVVVDTGLAYLIEELPWSVAALAVPGPGPRDTTDAAGHLAFWLDVAAAPMNKLVLPRPELNVRQLEWAVETSRLGHAFVVAHELAHIYGVNERHLRSRPGWVDRPPQWRSREVEHLADLRAADVVARWDGGNTVGTAGRPAGAAAHRGVALALTAVALLEEFDEASRPRNHPTAVQRLARLRDGGVDGDGDAPFGAQLDAVTAMLEPVTAAGLRIATGRRDAAARRMGRLMDDVRDRRARRRQIRRTATECLLLSQAATLRCLLARLAVTTGTDDPVRRAVSDVMSGLPMEIYDPFGSRFLQVYDPATRRGRRRATVRRATVRPAPPDPPRPAPRRPQ